MGMETVIRARRGDERLIRKVVEGDMRKKGDIRKEDERSKLK